ncbi:MAG: Matrixin, partial [Verrucomicrobiales bacterium]|nr:Matrixin [Verrucomicrobiales bacterium]
GANIPGATNPVFTLNGIARTDAGAYTLAVANDAGVASSAPAPLICSDIPTLNPADNISDRVALPTGNNPYQGFIQTLNGNATVETGEPDLAAKPGGHSVWFKWTAPASGIATFDTIGSTFDTLLGVFTGTNFATLSEVASDEDSGGYFRSLVQFNAKAGQVYAISVDGFSGRSGNVVLGWTLEPTTQLLPVFVQHPRSQTVLEGASVTLTVQVSNATPNTLYQWVFNGKVLPGVSGPDLLIPKVRPPNVGIYSVRVMDPAGRNVESRPAAIEIGTNPNVQSQDKLEDVLLNATGSAGFAFAKSLGFPPFVSVALGVPGAQVMNNTNSTADIDCFQIGTATRWLGIQVTNLASVTNCMLRVTTANSGIPTELAVYRYVSLACLQSVPCLHTNIMGCDTNSAGGGGSYSLLEFKPIPNAQYLVFADGLGGAQGIIQMNWQLGAAPAFTSSISNCTLVCDAGTNVTIHCGVTNAIPAPSCQWYYNGSPLAGANGITLSFPAVQPSNAGPYSVTISNAFGMLTNYCCLVVTPPQLNGKPTFTNGVPSTYSISSALLPGYVLQYTTNLSAPIVWQNAFTNATTNCSFVHVSPMVDTNGQTYPQRYYRAVSP